MHRLLQTKGKILGIDYGDKRTGLAVSDPTRLLAFGIGCVSVGGMQKTAEKIYSVIKEQNITGGIVIGLPVNMNGTEGQRAERVRKFSRYVEKILSGDERARLLPIIMLDERMTTMEASRYLNETDTKGAKRKGVIDSLSAQIILQNALDSLKYMKS